MQLRSQQDLPSISNKRKQIFSELRSNRRDQQLSKNRVGCGVILEEDIPLEQLLPRLQTEPNNAVNIIISIYSHLNVSKFQDVNMLFAYIPHFFSLLNQSDRLAYETLMLLTNLACEEPTFPYLIQNDHSYLIQLIRHQNSQIRMQTVWYISNLLSGGEEILYWLSSLLLIETCCSAVEMYNNDKPFIALMCSLLHTISQFTRDDNMEMSQIQSGDVNQPQNSVNFTNGLNEKKSAFDLSDKLFCLLITQLEECGGVACAVPNFSVNHKSFKRMIQMVPTLINRMVKLLSSNKLIIRDAAVHFCIVVSEEKPKYASKLCGAPRFFQYLHSLFAVGNSARIADLCYVASNLITVDKKVCYLLLNSNVFQAATTKVQRLSLSKNEVLEDVLVDYGWLIVKMMKSTTNYELSLMCSYETFFMMKCCMDVNDKKLILESIGCIQTILKNFVNELIIIDIIKWLDESELIGKLQSLSYCADQDVVNNANSTLFIYDTISIPNE
ncbi:Importin alpha [Entamoeba marina]